ncbi:hypothetical protein [Vibrio sp. A1-1]|uniref:hypothetical protein n=1 Tax=Vibrio sp. A1-1 TaxID=2912250 RepID=UPI001F37129F|nr:hypothetical protein [Vibrio sp. A1-1]EHU0358676.1 hypothetical protein [Vibrio parahaemolyticus]MCF7455918.1 hypothetical protein [Vibrio sp. A1-1]HCG6024078.1 hypothetical protein [Vibrio parahaemolyticus]HCH2721431.1 hypothetical protein [Vibrio parahaemolyticus]
MTNKENFLSINHTIDEITVSSVCLTTLKNLHTQAYNLDGTRKPAEPEPSQDEFLIESDQLVRNYIQKHMIEAIDNKERRWNILTQKNAEQLLENAGMLARLADDPNVLNYLILSNTISEAVNELEPRVVKTLLRMMYSFSESDADNIVNTYIKMQTNEQQTD